MPASDDPGLLPHYFLIRSSYTDIDLSCRRLELSKLTIAPCLKHQRTPITIILNLSQDDPLRSKRIELFSRVCDDVRIVSGSKWSDVIEGHEPRLITRVDDDDIIAAWFSERLQDAAASTHTETILYWPNGYVFADRLRLRSSPTNQFLTLLTNSDDLNETPFRTHHAHARDRWPVVEVDRDRAWCWTQHVDAKTFDQTRNWKNAKPETRSVHYFTTDFAAIARHLKGKALTAHQSTLNDWTLDVGRPSMAITSGVWREVRLSVKPQMRTLETGSGLSTILFDRLTDRHVALEDNPDWFQKMKTISQSVLSTAIDDSTGWYNDIPVGPFDFILIDGPTGKIGRDGILRYIDKLTHENTIVVVDDTHREAESVLSASIARVLGREQNRKSDCGKKFDVI